MPRLLLMMSDPESRQSFMEGAQALSGWLVDYASDMDELQAALSLYHWDIFALDTTSFESVDSQYSSFISSLATKLSVIVLVSPENLGREEHYLGFDVAGVVPCAKAWLSVPKQVYGRLRLLVWIWRRHTERRVAQIKKSRREAELAVLSELSRELLGVLDESALIMNLVHGVGVRCQNAAVAYISAESHDTELIHGLFTDSEVEDLERERTFNEPEPPTNSSSLSILHQYVTDDQLFAFLQPKSHESWTGALNQQSPVVFRRKPTLGAFPGLEPVWHRLKNGCVFVVPIWGRVEPLGLLIVAEFEVEDGEPLWSSVGLQTLAHQLGGAIENVRLINESQTAYQTLQSAQDKLVHAEKFAAVGHLAAQIAHEINNPSSFVISNLAVMDDYMDSLREFGHALMDMHLEHHPDHQPQLDALQEHHDVMFINEDMQALLEQSRTGMQRIHKIVKDLRYFAHDSGPELTWFSIEQLLDASVALIRAELKYRADIVCEFAGIEQVYSDANKLSQVFLNLLLNAAQALEEADPETDILRVGTIDYDDYLIIYVEDTGTGIPQEFIGQIFEPFFTTKERGQGTGLGLSISRDILLSLGGDIRVFSEVGKGTRFEVLLPVKEF